MNFKSKTSALFVLALFIPQIAMSFLDDLNPISGGLGGAAIGGIAGGRKGAGIGLGVGMLGGALNQASRRRYYDDDYVYDNDYRRLRSEFRRLTKDYNELLDYAKDLEKKYNDLQESFDKGQQQYNELREENARLEKAMAEKP